MAPPDPFRPGSLHDAAVPIELVLQDMRTLIQGLQTTVTGINGVVGEVQGRLIAVDAKLGALAAELAEWKRGCRDTHVKVEEDFAELREGRTEVTLTRMRTLEAENDRLKKAVGEWIRAGVFAIVGFVSAYLIYRLNRGH